MTVVWQFPWGPPILRKHKINFHACGKEFRPCDGLGCRCVRLVFLNVRPLAIISKPTAYMTLLLTYIHLYLLPYRETKFKFRKSRSVWVFEAGVAGFGVVGLIA